MYCFLHSFETNLGLIFCMENLLSKSVMMIPMGNSSTPASGGKERRRELCHRCRRHLSMSDGGPRERGLIRQCLPAFIPHSLSRDLHGEIAEMPPWDRQPLALGFLEDSERHSWHREIMLHHFFNVYRSWESGQSFPIRKMTSVLP